jgi:hypothetical protein
VNDPVPAITEAAATGETAAIFADIRQVLGVDVVNLIWRHLATMDGALPWAWQALRPLYADGSVIGQAIALRRDLALPPVPPIQAEVFAALGLRPVDMAAVRGVLSAYDHTNGMAVVALTALRGRLDGRVPAGIKPAEPTPVAEAARIALPKLLDLAGMQPETATLVTALNGFGTRRSGAVLASMYRHLAHWPSYLAFAWLLLAPMDGDGRLAVAIDEGPARGAIPRRRVAGATDRSGSPAAAGAGGLDQCGGRAVRRRRHRQDAGDLRIAAPSHRLRGTT